MEKNCSERITCSVSTKDLLLDECKQEYLKHHPEMEGVILTQSFLVRKVIDFYLGR